MFHIKSILLKRFKNWGNGDQGDDDVIKEKAEKFIKEKSTEDVEVLFYKNKTIYIKCLNSAVANELYLKQEEIKDGLNKVFNKKIVKKLIIKTR